LSPQAACLWTVGGSQSTWGEPTQTRGEHCVCVRVCGRDCRPSRCVTFSTDGTLFGWCNGQNVSIVNPSDGAVVSTFDLPKTALLEFSPLNNILVTWQLYTNSIANKLHMQKVSDFALSPGGQPSKVAVYVPGSKGAPSFVRLYQYPAFGGPTAALANKSFFKADRVMMQWNKKASAVLVTASTEVDKTGASYYGEQTLHYLGVNGETALVQLSKNGPIYDVAWSPSSTEFCVVYGFMPAKATVFNLKCDPVYDFGTGPRNAAYYSPQGHILILAGFGNLRGQMEVWDVKNYKQVSKSQAPDATHFSWCPDGEHIVTATCSPRLRVSNGYKIWHYTGSVLQKWDVAAGSELWEVRWQSLPDGSFPKRPIKYQAAPSQLGSTQAPPTQAYRPPALRHLPATPSSKLHEDEPPQDLRPGASGEKSLSKSALKNQRKREAKKAAKQEAKPEPEPPTDPAAVSNSQSEASIGDPEVEKKIKNLKKVKAGLFL
uniref:Eukaryotic translation initiation factor 2A n=1 Tax=Astatotilapia calliptera TaxID=8154 RepID=A0AAX7UX83_ASTCA